MTITADQAKTLLDDATDGIWTSDRGHPDEVFRILSIRKKKGGLVTGTTIADEIDSDGDAAMILSAPDLARTVIDQAEEIERLKTALIDHLRQEADQ
ncbi:hypothetical protein [Corynebacterium kalidii]